MQHKKSERFSGNQKSKGFLTCTKCKKIMKPTTGMKFNEYSIDGWKCPCGEIYYDPMQAQKILLLNKLKKEKIRAKLGKIRSNLIIRVPKDIEQALNLVKGEDVLIEIEGKGMKIIPT